MTVQTGLSKSPGGIQMELEDIESRNEEYPMTRAFLTFLSQMTETPVPAALGAGLRAPGFDPYLHYILEDVFLKFSTRAYKNSAEKVRFVDVILCEFKHYMYFFFCSPSVIFVIESCLVPPTPPQLKTRDIH